MKEELVKLWREFKSHKRNPCEKCKESRKKLGDSSTTIDQSFLLSCVNEGCVNTSFVRTDIGMFLDFLESKID